LLETQSAIGRSTYGLRHMFVHWSSVVDFPLAAIMALCTTNGEFLTP